MSTFHLPPLEPVLSSNLARVGYDAASETLVVEFRPATLYAYEGVPPDLYRALLLAPSKGAFLNAAVKGVYPYRRLEVAA